MTEYIEKSKVINFLIGVENRANRNEGNYRKTGIPLYRDLCETEIRIGKMTAADVAPVVHGHWESSGEPCEKFNCSVCGGASWYYDYHGDVAKSRYCPNCGAKMDLEEEYGKR